MMPGLTTSQVLTMEAGPDFNALVAERVMGWQLTEWETFEQPFEYSTVDRITHKGWTQLDGTRREHWSPSTDVADDYEVLVFVRENWDKGKRLTFGFQLSTIFDDRWTIDDFGDIETAGYYYQPGDYSRAALLTTIGETK